MWRLTKPELAEALNKCTRLGFAFPAANSGSALARKLPLASNRKFKAAKIYLDSSMDELVGQRRAEGLERGDLLSLLLEIYDTGNEQITPGAVSKTSAANLQVRNELLTFFLAGHDIYPPWL